MILVLTTAVALLIIAVITLAISVRNTRTGTNEMAMELHKQTEEARGIANEAHARIDSFPRVTISCEAIVCAVEEARYSVMFANVHYPALANKKQAYVISLPRLPNEPVFTGQVRVFDLTACYSYPPSEAKNATRPA